MNVRPAVETDLPALTEIYNHYVLHMSITFDTQPFSPEARRPWFIEHTTGGARIRLFVAAGPEDRAIGYATTSRFRPKAAYDTTVESSIYCAPAHVHSGVGTRLYRALRIDCGRRHQPNCRRDDDAEPGLARSASGASAFNRLAHSPGSDESSTDTGTSTGSNGH